MAMFTTVSNHNVKLEQIDLPNSESTRVLSFPRSRVGMHPNNQAAQAFNNPYALA
ncbi:hypothetical protein P886_0701 [Alteromonadaceae bacterium 2753L.S.0a.02]|nr:hypothetical protein P886_0701 [Alteromonadaceae bacterium 2753L.S.0a.02]